MMESSRLLSSCRKSGRSLSVTVTLSMIAYGFLSLIVIVYFTSSPTSNSKRSAFSWSLVQKFQSVSYTNGITEMQEVAKLFLRNSRKSRLQRDGTKSMRYNTQQWRLQHFCVLKYIKNFFKNKSGNSRLLVPGIHIQSIPGSYSVAVYIYTD